MGESVKKTVEMPSRRYWLGLGGARVFALVITVAGVAGSVVFSRMRYENETRRIEAAFEAEARNAESLLMRELRLFYDVLDSLGRLHSISGDINAEAFAEFVQKGMQYQLQILGTFGLSPRVYGPARSGYESAMRQVRGTDFSLVERDAGGALIIAQQRPFYFPVSYVVPERASRFPAGLDLAADAETLAGMRRAIGERGSTAGGYVAAGSPGENRRLIVSPIVRPVPGYDRSNTTLEWVDGFAFAVLDPARIVERALQYFNSEGIRIRLYDEEGDRQTLIYEGAAAKEISPVDEELMVVASIHFGGINWRLVCVPTRDFIMARRTLMPWIILAGGLVATLIVALQFVQLAGRTEKVRRLVQQRTAELSSANQRLEREIDRRHALQREIIDISTQEKRRLGQDLHDSLGQKLTGIGLLASGLSRSLSEQPQLHGQARQIAELLKDARAQTRRMAKGLTPVELDVEGLPDALDKLARDVSASGSVQCCFVQEAVPVVRDGHAAVHIYHIAQEAVNNALKHAGAQHIEIMLSVHGLRIADDGRGLRGEAAAQDGLGLKIMNYRAETVGGKLELSANDPCGTVVTLAL
jgi:signal transduction histidine kinase